MKDAARWSAAGFRDDGWCYLRTGLGWSVSVNQAYRWRVEAIETSDWTLSAERSSASEDEAFRLASALAQLASARLGDDDPIDTTAKSRPADQITSL